MVLGTDGRMMHKSLGNYVATPEVFNKYGADASRQWAASGGTTGSDIPFRWPDVEYGWRFQIKLWNAARFASLALRDYTPKQKLELQLVDRWVLSRLERVTKRVTDALEKCQFNTATEEVRTFTWHQLCDRYIEAIKHRLYNPEKHGEEEKRAAQYTLYTAIYRILQLFAPIAPHITEEMYRVMYAEEKKHKSIHISPWPKPDEKIIDEDAEEYGDLAMAIIGEIRRAKAEKGLPLNTPIKEGKIHAAGKKSARILNQAVEDIQGTCKIEKLTVLHAMGEGRSVQDYSDIHLVLEY
jgi:valyl-tRNA synthetase